jgi:hypothetical protein
MTDDLAEVRALYPDLPPDDLATARENLDRYLMLAWEIWEERELAVEHGKTAPVDRPD